MLVPSRRYVLALATTGLLLTGCGSDDPSVTTPTGTGAPTPSPTSAATATGTSSDAPTTAAPSTTDTAAAPTATVVVAGGQVDGPDRVEVATGDTVVLEVTSDVDDEIHVHGYDVRMPVAAGDTVTIELVADIPGVFEVELEQAGLDLVELEVR